MKLYELRPKKGSRKKPKRKGCGTGSGHGKTSGRGHKGQKARSGGGKPRLGFEGGQTPLIRRVPKRGFTSKFKKVFQIVNIGTLNRFKDNSVITPEILKKENIIKKADVPIKVLGDGELLKPLKVKAHLFSSTAIKKIQSAGGLAELISAN
jgi:large subunit ribosomal protein L15